MDDDVKVKFSYVDINGCWMVGGWNFYVGGCLLEYEDYNF